MWKKMEGGCGQGGRPNKARDRSSGQEWAEMGSLSSISVEQAGDRKQLRQVNFQFDPSGGTRQEGRVHSKQGSRRVGGKVVMQRQKHRHKENDGLPHANPKNDKDSELEGGSQVVLLGIKSCLLEKEEGKSTTNLQKHTRYSSNAESCASRPEDHANIYITTIPTKNTDDLFREISRRMAEEKESGRVRRTNQNCFFYNLKRKLQREITRIEQQSQRNDCKLLIEGCEIEKHRRNNVQNSASLTDRVRPKSALASDRAHSSIASSASRSQAGRGRRPMSCQSRPQAPSQQLRAMRAESRRLLGTKEGKQQRNTVREKECEKKYIANSLITFDNPNSLKPYKSPAGKAGRQKDNQKLNQILNECSSHQAAFNNLSSKMRTFEYYCKKMSAGMEDAGHKLGELNDAAELDD